MKIGWTRRWTIRREVVEAVSSMDKSGCTLRGTYERGTLGLSMGGVMWWKVRHASVVGWCRWRWRVVMDDGIFTGEVDA